MRINKSSLPTVSQILMSSAKDSWSNLLASIYNYGTAHADLKPRVQILKQCRAWAQLSIGADTVLSNDRCNARLGLLLTPNLLVFSWNNVVLVINTKMH